MEHFLQMVEEPFQQQVETDEAKLKYFISKVKIWDYTCLGLNDNQKLSVEDRSSVLKNYYLEMRSRYSDGTGKVLLVFICLCFCCFLFL